MLHIKHKLNSELGHCRFVRNQLQDCKQIITPRLRFCIHQQWKAYNIGLEIILKLARTISSEKRFLRARTNRALHFFIYFGNTIAQEIALFKLDFITNYEYWLITL